MADKAEEPRGDDRVSLYPLDPLEALRAALQVDPDSEPVEPSVTQRESLREQPDEDEQRPS